MINNLAQKKTWCVTATRKMNHSNLTHRICMVNVMGRQDGHYCQDLSVEAVPSNFMTLSANMHLQNEGHYENLLS